MDLCAPTNASIQSSERGPSGQKKVVPGLRLGSAPLRVRPTVSPRGAGPGNRPPRGLVVLPALPIRRTQERPTGPCGSRPTPRAASPRPTPTVARPAGPSSIIAAARRRSRPSMGGMAARSVAASQRGLGERPCPVMARCAITHSPGELPRGFPPSRDGVEPEIGPFAGDVALPSVRFRSSLRSLLRVGPGVAAGAPPSHRG